MARSQELDLFPSRVGPGSQHTHICTHMYTYMYAHAHTRWREGGLCKGSQKEIMLWHSSLPLGAPCLLPFPAWACKIPKIHSYNLEGWDRKAHTVSLTAYGKLWKEESGLFPSAVCHRQGLRKGAGTWRAWETEILSAERNCEDRLDLCCKTPAWTTQVYDCAVHSITYGLLQHRKPRAHNPRSYTSFLKNKLKK